MIASLEKEFNQLEKQLDHLLGLVKPLSEAQQNFKPDANSWSMLQIFRHMIQSESQINRYLQKKILGAGTTERAGLVAWLRSFVLNTAMRLPIKYKVPPSIQTDLDGPFSYDELSARWRASRKELRDFLQNIDEATAKKEIFRHPVVGRMSIIQGLSFMQEHVARHTEQAERILKDPGFPK